MACKVFNRVRYALPVLLWTSACFHTAQTISSSCFARATRFGLLNPTPLRRDSRWTVSYSDICCERPIISTLRIWPYVIHTVFSTFVTLTHMHISSLRCGQYGFRDCSQLMWSGIGIVRFLSLHTGHPICGVRRLLKISKYQLLQLVNLLHPYYLKLK